MLSLGARAFSLGGIMVLGRHGGPTGLCLHPVGARVSPHGRGMGSPGHPWPPLQSLTPEGDEHPWTTTRPCGGTGTPCHPWSPPGHPTAPTHQRDAARTGGASAPSGAPSAPGGAQPSQGL